MRFLKVHYRGLKRTEECLVNLEKVRTIERHEDSVGAAIYFHDFGDRIVTTESFQAVERALMQAGITEHTPLSMPPPENCRSVPPRPYGGDSIRPRFAEIPPETAAFISTEEGKEAMRVEIKRGLRKAMREGTVCGICLGPKKAGESECGDCRGEALCRGE